MCYTLIVTIGHTKFIWPAVGRRGAYDLRGSHEIRRFASWLTLLAADWSRSCFNPSELTVRSREGHLSWARVSVERVVCECAKWNHWNQLTLRLLAHAVPHILLFISANKFLSAIHKKMCRYCVHNFTVPVLTQISSFWETNLFFSMPLTILALSMCISSFVSCPSTLTLPKSPHIPAYVQIKCIGVRLRASLVLPCPASGSTQPVSLRS